MELHKNNFSGQTAVITGATSGIGKSLSFSFAKMGADLVLLCRNKKKMNLLKSELAKIPHNKLIFECVDLYDRSALNNTLKYLSKEVEDVGIIVNNAGSYPDISFESLNYNVINQSISLHVYTAHEIIKTFLPQMKQKGFGRIVGVSSAAAFMGSRSPAYAISKNALIGLSRSLVKEVAAYGITTNIVVPGPIRTPMTDNLSEEQIDTYIKKIPAGRFGTIDEVVWPILFLCSQNAGYINGQCLHINGGLFLSD